MKFDHSAAHKQYSLAAIAKVLLNDNKNKSSQKKGEMREGERSSIDKFHSHDLRDLVHHTIRS
ncbi:MAG: hypothetical protein WCF23_03835 [Candidatus Nitrosopolaris sp.]